MNAIFQESKKGAKFAKIISMINTGIKHNTGGRECTL